MLNELLFQKDFKLDLGIIPMVRILKKNKLTYLVQIKSQTIDIDSILIPHSELLKLIKSKKVVILHETSVEL